MTLSNPTIAHCLSEYGIQSTEPQCNQVRTYISLLLKWNRSISLSSVTREPEILKFHFGESAFALSAIEEIKNGRLADVGTGAGFPGLPLKIFAEDMELVLIEPNAKKCAFLAEVVRELSLRNVSVARERFENLAEYERGLDTIVSRALGSYEKLLGWARRSLAPGGRVVLWLGHKDAQKISEKPGWSWGEAIAIPGSAHRVILASRPRKVSAA